MEKVELYFFFVIEEYSMKRQYLGFKWEKKIVLITGFMGTPIGV